MQLTLEQWAIKHGVSRQALIELRSIMGVFTESTPGVRTDDSESAVLNEVRLEAAEKGIWLMRNNVGACQDKHGRLIRYGLCNDTKQLNETVKSSDLIGVRPLLITPELVGSTIGQFVMREVKKRQWQWGEDPSREIAQLRFLEKGFKLGCDVGFATGRGTL